MPTKVKKTLMAQDQKLLNDMCGTEESGHMLRTAGFFSAPFQQTSGKMAFWQLHGVANQPANVFLFTVVQPRILPFVLLICTTPKHFDLLNLPSWSSNGISPCSAVARFKVVNWTCQRWIFRSLGSPFSGSLARISLLA